MRMKDENEVKAGKLRKDQVMSYKVDEKDGKIEKIQVFNYKDKQRLNEIINTAIWTFTRMLEKQV
jgi:IMP cyclohydrolase